MSQEAAPEPRARKAFPTWYSGRSYRSRLEADFARLLDALQICFEYEPQSFLLDDGTHYLPDFWCPDLDLWVETRGYRSEKGSRQINGFARLLQALSRERPTSYMVLSVNWTDDMFLTGNRSERLPVVANPGVLPICDRCGRGSLVAMWGGEQKCVYCRRCGRSSRACFATSIFVSGDGYLMLGESRCEDTATATERLLHSEPVVGHSWRAAEWIERHEGGWCELREWNQGPSLSGLDDEWCEAEKAREIALRER